ncbi:MAG: hypothetical protein JWP91_3233 [Fibrobacteres bacterium]|nr:hypothetical protein [Fibrobacterota bacterium]
MFRLRDYSFFLKDKAGALPRLQGERAYRLPEARDPQEPEGGAMGIADVTRAPAESGTPADAHLSGNVWMVLVEPGQSVEAGKAKKMSVKEGMLILAGPAPSIHFSPHLLTSGQKWFILKLYG